MLLCRKAHELENELHWQEFLKRPKLNAEYFKSWEEVNRILGAAVSQEGFVFSECDGLFEVRIVFVLPQTND